MTQSGYITHNITIKIIKLDERTHDKYKRSNITCDHFNSDNFFGWKMYNYY